MGTMAASSTESNNKETALFNAYLGLDDHSFTRLTRTQSQPSRRFYHPSPPSLHYPPPPTSPLNEEQREIVHIPSKVATKTKTTKKQKFVLRRQKTESEIRSDLNALLPLTPPFEPSRIGMPQNLSRSKTTPFAFPQQTKQNKKKSKKIKTQMPTAPTIESRIGFNFANFDLNEKIKQIKQDLIGISAEIS